MNIKRSPIAAATVVALAALAVLAAPAAAVPVVGADGQVETLVAFDPAAGEFPEGIAADKSGDLYVSMFLLDEVRRIDATGAQSEHTRLVQGAAPAGLAFDAAGILYVAATGFDLATGQTDPTTRGVYRVDRDGSAERIPGTAAILFPNDLAFDKRGNLYVTDAVGGAVWRIGRNGSVELWSDHSLLRGTGDLGLGFPYGANGIAFSRDRLIVSNTERGTLVTLPIQSERDGGEPSLLAESLALVGVDGIALDVRGNVFAAVNGQSTVVAIQTDGSIDVLATADDGLDQPSTLTFGTGVRDHDSLFIVNFAVFSPAPHPGVLEMTVESP